MNNTNNTNTNSQGNAEKPVGAVWVKQSSSGREYLSMKVTDSNGVDHNYVAFLAKSFEPGSNKPKYNIFVSRRGTEINAAKAKEQNLPPKNKKNNVKTSNTQDDQDDASF